jgi:hypothetical protein
MPSPRPTESIAFSSSREAKNGIGLNMGVLSADDIEWSGSDAEEEDAEAEDDERGLEKRGRTSSCEGV